MNGNQNINNMRVFNLLILLVAIVLMSCKSTTEQQSTTSEVTQEVAIINEAVKTKVFAEKLAAMEGTANVDYYLIDVRTPEEYAEGHLANAKNIDFYEDGFKDEMATLDADKTMFIYCRSGGRSGKTANMLEGLGFKEVYDLAGGVIGWEKNEMPFEVE